MTDWRMRMRYGHGVARVALAAPLARLEMAPARPAHVVVSALSPLYLAVLLATATVVIATLGLAPKTLVNDAKIFVTTYEPVSLPKPVAEVQAPLATATPEPTVAQAQPLERSPNNAVAPSRAEPAFSIAMDAVDVVPRTSPRAASAHKRNTIPIGPTAARARASDFAHVEVAAALQDPLDVRAPRTQARALPHVSLPGASSASTLDGVGSHDLDVADVVGASFGPPRTPLIAQLPEPAAFELSALEVAQAPGGGEASAFASSQLAGVPLQTLAACDSRAREDSLKQQLMLSADNGTTCVAADGTYSFLEAKNLNAFLMHITRDVHRQLGNRCDELVRAQMCVATRQVGGVQP